MRAAANKNWVTQFLFGSPLSPVYKKLKDLVTPPLIRQVRVTLFTTLSYRINGPYYKKGGSSNFIRGRQVEDTGKYDGSGENFKAVFLSIFFTLQSL